MKQMKPRSIKRGDVIGIVAPASAPSSQEKIHKGAEYLERLGYRVKLGSNVRAVRGYLAGSDEQRASDLNEMFRDKKVKAIFAVRGGYGTPRLLPYLDYSLIRRNPKILVGYSDLTALQLGIFRKTGLVSFSGPMVGVEMFKGIDAFTEECFWKIITSTKKPGVIRNPDGRPLEVLHKGEASGVLLGGNLSLITSITGTPYLPSFKNSILYLEEVEEECYRFDRMMNQLKLAGIFRDTRGVLVGELTDVKASDTTKPFLTADEILDDYLTPLAKPVMKGLVYGHVARKITMPVGIKGRIETNAGTLEFLEPAVS